MSTTQNPHPARSPEFLSRLHDQDLSPAERAHFESHRAHCAECRTAAAEFEAALALFRSTGPRPAAPDLSARILRKLQQSQMTSRRRLHFGPSFGIDLRWAGAFAAAVIAVIVGSSVVVRNEARQSVLLKAPPSLEESAKKEDAPAPAAKSLGTDTRDQGKARGPEAAGERSRRESLSGGLLAPPKPAAEKAAEPGVYYDKDEKAAFQERDALAKQKEAGRLTAHAPAVLSPSSAPSGRAGAVEQREEAASGFADRAQVSTQAENRALDLRAAQDASGNKLQQEAKRPARQAAPKSEASISRNDPETQSQGQSQNQSQSQNQANRNVAANYAQAPPPAAAAATAPHDAERAGGEGASNAYNYDGVNAANVRLLVAPLDDAGAAPDMVPLTASDVPASLKGQEFVVIVDMAGRVQQVTPRHPAPADSKRQNEKRLKKATPPPSPLATLRFQPGARQRRLLVRVE